jgi:hypothetical protein
MAMPDLPPLALSLSRLIPSADREAIVGDLLVHTAGSRTAYSSR